MPNRNANAPSTEYNKQEERNDGEEEEFKEEMKEEPQPIMILNIDIGNNQIEQLRIFNQEQPEKEAYEFCFQHQLDYSSLVEITKQIHSFLNESKKAQSTLNEAQLQDNLLTTLQTESKTDNLPSSTHQSKRNQNNGHCNHSQNPNLVSYTDQDGKSKKHITPQELITNEIVVTDNNNFYLVNKPKSKERIDNSGNISKINSKSQQQQQKSIKDNRGEAIGAQMYQKGLDKIKQRKEKVNSLRDALNKSDEEIYTFKPKVNSQNPMSKAYRDKNNKAYNNPQTILHYRQYNEQKKKRLIEEQKEKDDYPSSNTLLFTPMINKRSETIDKSKLDKSFSSRFEKLYQDKDVLKRKIQTAAKAIEDEYSYCPQLNPTDKVQEEKKLQNSFKVQEKKQKLLKEKEWQFNYDKVTNQKLFQPKLITRYKTSKEIQKEQKVNEKKHYETMYNFADYYKKRKTKLAEEVNDKETSNSYTSLRTSNDLFNKKKLNAFKRIFKLLDSDEDGIISSHCYNSTKLPKEVINILKPIFAEFNEDYETLTEAEFIRVCDQLYQYCSREQRNALVTFYDCHSKKNKKAPSMPFPFKPSINKNTSAMMKRIDKMLGIEMQNISRIDNNSFKNNNI